MYVYIQNSISTISTATAISTKENENGFYFTYMYRLLFMIIKFCQFSFYLAVDGQIISGQNSQGLLIPAASMGQVASSSTAASLSTSVVPTSAIQSVMTTQIQVCT